MYARYRDAPHNKIPRWEVGGSPKQMELFDVGGLKDEGGTTDPVSGNDVPIGSLKEEVRDDIPAMLSEGEFVFPADVVRYHGLKTYEDMRLEAKMGLMAMKAEGQIVDIDEEEVEEDYEEEEEMNPTDHVEKNEVEIAYLGLLEEYQNKKLGSFLLSEAIKNSFNERTQRVWVHTCSLDHKFALANYISRGFRVFKKEQIDFVA